MISLFVTLVKYYGGTYDDDDDNKPLNITFQHCNFCV